MESDTRRVGPRSAGPAAGRWSARGDARRLRALPTAGRAGRGVVGVYGDSATTTIQRRTDLSITKTDSPDPVNAGGTVTYTLTVHNGGGEHRQAARASLLMEGVLGPSGAPTTQPMAMPGR